MTYKDVLLQIRSAIVSVREKFPLPGDVITTTLSCDSPNNTDFSI